MTDQNVSQPAADTGNAITLARADVESLPAGSAGPANGNVITGQGTDTGVTGADTVGHAPAHVIAVQGAGAAQPVTAGSVEVTGHFGVLTINADGTFHYVPNAGAPAGVQDVFNYTLADSTGAPSSSTLTIDLGVAGAAATQTAAQQTNLPPGVVTLPAGVQLSDVHVVGSDLVVHLPDGTQMVIPDGAIFVPQFVIGNVEVPAQNVAALLVDSEPKPAAGPPESAGGNFAGDVPPLDPGVPLGNLLPPTDFGYQPPQFQEPGGGINHQPTVVIETPDNPAGVVDASESVFEKGLPARGSLPAGSGEIADGNAGNNSDPSETNTGTIVFNAQDGLASVTIDGTAVTAVGQQIQGQYGVLTITGIDLATGQITYSYTLSTNTGGDTTQDVFTVVVTDSNGDAATASLTVHIVDDVPTAHDDSGTQGANNAPVTVNVIANDVQGADGVNLATGVHMVSGSLTGTGTVHYNGDGTFTYTPGAGESGDVTFQYTITDADGDTSTATVTIHLHPDSQPTISTSGDNSVDEAALPVGSNPSSTAETATGSININSPDGVSKLVINGVDVTNGGHVTGADGVLTVTHNADGTYSYSYTLSGPTSNDAAGDNFSITVTDSDGDTASTTLHVTIADDVPTAHNDSGTETTPGSPVTVNVIANDVQGADGVNLATGVHMVSGSLTGTGTVHYNGDGTFTYTPGAGESGDVTFQYTITDGDGDTSTATVTIHLNAAPTIDVSGDNSVDEAALPVGSDPSSNAETAAGSININSPDGISKLVVNGVDVTAGGTVTTADGVLTVTHNADGTYSYSYTLSGPTSNDAAGDDFSLTVTDGNGDTASTTLHITIADDVPTAHDDSATEGSENAPVTVNVIANDVQGADGVNLATGVHLVSGSLSGSGVLVYNSDGTFTYTPSAGESGDVTFQYTITDGDGDTSTATVTIHLLADSTPTISTSGGDTVDEAALPVGSDPSSPNETTSGTIDITTGGDTVAKLVINGVDVTGGGTVTGADGVLTVTLVSGVYHYSYTLSGPTSADAAGEDFHMTVTDSDGDTASTTLHVNIIDDVPTAANDSNTVSEGGTLTVSAANGVESNDVFGADGKAAGGGVTGVEAGSHPGDVVAGGVGAPITGTYGTLTLNADGSYTYHATPNSNPPSGATDVFTYTITDGDGDTSTATLTIHVSDVTASVGSASTYVSEEALATIGSEHGGDTDADSAHDVVTNSGTIALNDSSSGVTFTTALTIPVGTYTSGGTTIVWTLSNGGQTLTGKAGATTVLVATIDNTGHYTVTLSAPIDTPNGGAGENGGDSVITIGVTATDSDGNTLTNGSLTVHVEDDAPTASGDTNSTAAGTTLTVTAASTADVLHNDVAGADGFASGGGVVGVAAGTNTSVALSTGVGTVIHGTYGDLTLHADGSYTYVAKPNVSGVDHFVYTVADGDGDTSTTTLNITVNAVSASVGSSSTVVSEEVLLAGTEHGGDTDSDAANDVLTNSGTITLSDSISGATFTTALTAPVGTYTSGGTTIVWTLSNGGHTLTGKAGATTVLVATIDNTGHYTVTLSAPIDTPNGGLGENGGDSVITIGVTATDNYGNTLTSGSLTVNVEDDAPTVGTIQALSADNNPADPTSTGTLHLSSGADGFGSVTINPTLTGITSGGHALVGHQVGNVYTAYIDANGNGVYDAGTDTSAVFTISVDPNAGTSGQYTFDLLQPLDGKIVTTPIDSSSAFGAGPAQTQILSGNSGAAPLATISGWTTVGTTFNEATWLATGNAGNITEKAVNGATVGWGVDNNSFTTGEFMRFDFSQTTDYDGPGGYTPPPTVLPNAATATFELVGYTASDTITFMVHYTDGSYQVFTEHGNATHDATFTLGNPPAGAYIDYIELYADSAAPGKIDLVSVGAQSTTVDVTIPVSMTFTDGDGDQTTGSTTIHVADGQTATTPAAVVHTASVTTTSVPTDGGRLGIHHNGEVWNSGRASVVMGALAAAGLVAEPLAAKGHFGNGLHQASTDHGTVHTETLAPVAINSGPAHVADHLAQPILSVSGNIAPQHQGHGGLSPTHIVVEHGAQHLPTALPLHEVGQQGAHPAAHAIIANAIHMPAAAQLLALINQQHAGTDTVQNHGGHQVGQVLADALAGGAGHGSAIDAILHNVASHGGPVGGLNPLASHFAGGVSNGDNGHLAVFTAIQTAHIEHLIAHSHAGHPHG